MEAKARKRSQKLSAKFTSHADLKDLLKQVKFTPEDAKAKRTRRVQKS